MLEKSGSKPRTPGKIDRNGVYGRARAKIFWSRPRLTVPYLKRAAANLPRQVDDPNSHVETLKGALVETRKKAPKQVQARSAARSHDRGNRPGQAARAQTVMGDNSKSAAFERLNDACITPNRWATAESTLTDDVGGRLTRLDRDTEWTASSPI